MKRVLLVEDDSSNIFLYKKIFEKYGKEYEVEYISDPIKASKRIPRNNFDILITDLDLNNDKIDGFKLAKLCYSMCKPVIIITGHGLSFRLKYYVLYPDIVSNTKYLQKPINPGSLMSNIHEMLSRKQPSLNEMFNKIIKDI